MRIKRTLQPYVLNDKINFLKEWRKKYPISSLRLIDDTDNYTDFFESKEDAFTFI